MYAVNVLSRHQVNPTEDDWGMVIRVFRYLKGTKSLRVKYLGKGNIVRRIVFFTLMNIIVIKITHLADSQGYSVKKKVKSQTAYESA